MTRIFLVGDSPELVAAVLRQGGLRLSGQVPNLTLLLPLVRDCPADVLLITREGLDDWPPEQALPRLRALNPQLRLAVVLQPGEGAAGADWAFGPQTTPGQMLRAILAGPEPPGGPDSPLAGATGRLPEGLLRLFARSPTGETAGNSTAPIVDAGPPSPPAPEVVAFCGPKGGVGKTTLAANLAAALARDGARSVLLVDLSLRSADVGVHLDLLDGPTLVDALPYAAEGQVEKILPYVQEHRATGLKVMLGPPRAELGEVVEPQAVSALLRVFKRQFTLIVVDSSGRCAEDTLGECLQAADQFVMVTTMDPAALRQTKMEVEALRRVGVPVGERVVVAANRVHPDDAVNRHQAEEFLGLPIAVEVAEDYPAASRALLAGEPAVLRGSGNGVAAGVTELVVRLGLAVRTPPVAQGWLARLGRR